MDILRAERAITAGAYDMTKDLAEPAKMAA